MYKSKFSEKDWSFLVQYPCRVGLWMSDLEMGGGDGAEIAERRALENIIIRAQEKYENRAFIKELINCRGKQ